METLMIVGIALLAVLVGAGLPAIYQLNQTLRTSRKLMENLDSSVKPTLKELEEATARLNRIGGALEESIPRVKELLDAVGGLGKTINDFRSSVHSAASLGATIAPVVASAIRAFRGSCGSEEGEPGDCEVDQVRDGDCLNDPR